MHNEGGDSLIYSIINILWFSCFFIAQENFWKVKLLFTHDQAPKLIKCL